MNKNIILLITLCTIGLTGCVKVFQPSIQQGNIINNSDLQEIRAGMSKDEVLYILGTPMVTDPFNSDRWDYFYSRKDQNRNETTTRQVTAIFENDSLVELAGDVNLSNIEKLDPSREDRHNGGTIITEPTQRKKGIITRWLSNRKKKK